MECTRCKNKNTIMGENYEEVYWVCLDCGEKFSVESK